jgi:hypothetical protein
MREEEDGVVLRLQPPPKLVADGSSMGSRERLSLSPFTDVGGVALCSGRGMAKGN